MHELWELLKTPLEIPKETPPAEGDKWINYDSSKECTIIYVGPDSVGVILDSSFRAIRGKTGSKKYDEFSRDFFCENFYKKD